MGQDRGVQGWLAVVPVKSLEAAKTRLRGAVPGVRHDRLVLAMALDTVAAVLACPAITAVTVVTADPRVAAAAGGLGARCVRDEPAGGINAAVAHGAARARAEAGPGTLGVAVLTADLPALAPAELAAALTAAEQAGRAGQAGQAGQAGALTTAGQAGERAFVADAAGTGTVLLTALRAAVLWPRFGPGSAAAHAASGAVRLGGDWPGLRGDVDTAADLATARALGVGRHTAELLDAARYGVPGRGRRIAPAPADGGCRPGPP